ncbi:amidoligase [Halioglobus maricola]|uniref:Amidoligase n=1 Tax=Halioglobus maricola TaxID=2601894 RepID=A0A5P9NIQ3_9GAMM|nr:amidoligase family protein [Halioglobus maricola]QFU75720.1 amidoligase [Halioglobus maricola]
MAALYQMPPVLLDSSDEPRRAGFEFEFGNLPIAETSSALCEALGGRLETLSPFEAIIHDSSLGRLKVERDANILKAGRYRKWLGNLGLEFEPGSLGHELETNIDNASRGLVPCEVVTAPIPLTEIQQLDILVDTLNKMGAEGTQQSIIYAFGLHINASIPRLDAPTTLAYIQSFLLLHAWIMELAETDRTRRYLTRYIDPFPPEYVQLALDNSYQPSSHRLVADYMQHNPTRNRALDMLPILSMLDEKTVLENLSPEERELVSARPAFHYRLPDCKVNEPDWSVSSAWNRWVMVETLAADDSLRSELIDTWQEHSEHFSLLPNSRWIAILTSLLGQKLLLP